MLPVWYQKVKKLVDEKKIHLIGVVQEQHPDRSKLYRQWKQYDFPILVDSLNLLDFKVIPIVMGLDESGVVRENRLNMRSFEAFLKSPYDKSEVNGSKAYPSIDELKVKKDYRRLGEALFLNGDETTLDDAVSAFQEAVKLKPQDARAHFRLGVALRKRYESRMKKDGDSQKAIESWTKALSLDPNQYIWRRRLQQYGPRLSKPYNFYSWVTEARQAIKARGETPHPLSSEPQGSELLDRRKKVDSKIMPNPDPDGKVNLDEDSLVTYDVSITPTPVKPGDRVRVRFTFNVDTFNKVAWNNEGGGIELNVSLPEGFKAMEGTYTVSNSKKGSSTEKRVLECEIEVDKKIASSTKYLKAYVCFHVCESVNGTCYYLRKNVNFSIKVDKKAPSIR